MLHLHSEERDHSEVVEHTSNIVGADLVSMMFLMCMMVVMMMMVVVMMVTLLVGLTSCSISLLCRCLSSWWRTTPMFTPCEKNVMVGGVSNLYYITLLGILSR